MWSEMAQSLESVGVGDVSGRSSLASPGFDGNGSSSSCLVFEELNSRGESFYSVTFSECPLVNCVY